ncbi:MAG: alpha/beta fold hydrolase, partial [Planctomycetaceae bacterium]|nr:alpha/beta fold hydrolase [Planctomycetaceae bacterium]
EPVGLGGSPNLHYALELSQRGYITLSPDFPSLGEYEWKLADHPQYASGTMQAIWNHIRAVDLLASLPEVDAQRMGVIGHSLGGHNAMFLGAFEPRLKVIVSSCGFTRFHKDDLPSWTGERYMPRIASVYNNDPDRMPFDFAEIVGTFAPRAFFASAATGDDDFDVTGVKEVMDSAAFVYKLYGMESKLEEVYPESPHDFPLVAREAAYEFVGGQLK